MKERLINAMEVSLLVGCTVPTLNSWYRWKKLEPDHELAKILPDYVRIGNRNTRYWKESDVYKIIEFRSKLPVGRNGVLGEVTQKYCKRRKSDE